MIPSINSSGKLILLFLAGALLLAALPGCSTQVQSRPAMMPLGQMPPEIRSAPAIVQQAYRFAAANPDVMKQIPCYCGCGSVGHTSNYSCYVSGVDGNGAITYDPHALGCSLCVDITQDAMRLLSLGKTPQEIKTSVDATYSKYGLSNMP